MWRRRKFFECVNENIITFNGLQYGIITSPITRKKWLNRNLGASQACTSSTDRACYGDYYQWGRLADGHEKINSTTTSTLAKGITNVGNQFIIRNNDWTTADSDGSKRVAQWSKTDGTGVCPVGFRVPTASELENKTIDYDGKNANPATGKVKVIDSGTAFSNFLKLPVAGSRGSSSGSMVREGSWGSVWTITSGRKARSQHSHFKSDSATWGFYERTECVSVRCVEN